MTHRVSPPQVWRFYADFALAGPAAAATHVLLEIWDYDLATKDDFICAVAKDFSKRLPATRRGGLMRRGSARPSWLASHFYWSARSPDHPLRRCSARVPLTDLATAPTRFAASKRQGDTADAAVVEVKHKGPQLLLRKVPARPADSLTVSIARCRGRHSAAPLFVTLPAEGAAGRGP